MLQYLGLVVQLVLIKARTRPGIENAIEEEEKTAGTGYWVGSLKEV
jgi:hypothetical protein